MVWRAAVDGEARILWWGASAGVRRGGVFFCFPRRSLAANSLRGPRLSAGVWDPLSWACDHFYSLFASRFAILRANARARKN